MWLGGQIHDLISQHIRQFIPQRREGHMVTTASLSQIPDPKPILASSEWVGFLDRRLRMRMDLNTARSEGLILNPPPQPATLQPAPQSQAPQGNAPALSHHISKESPNMMGGHLNEQRHGQNLGMGVGTNNRFFICGEHSNHRSKLSKPALALRVVFVTGIAMGCSPCSM